MRSGSPPETTTVHLVRHAAVENPDGVLYGRAAGFPLSRAGELMAADLALAMAQRDVVAVWSSPLQRARQTAGPVAAEHGLPVRSDPRLTEASSVLEGSTATLERSVLRQPRVWPRLWNPFRPSWGEPYREVASRMTAVVRAAAAAHVGHDVVLVSHQMPIWVLRRQASGRRLAHDPRRRECGLASVTSLAVSNGHLTVIGYTAT